MTQGRNRFDGAGHIKKQYLMIGPTGVENYLIKLICKEIGIPFVKGMRPNSAKRGMSGDVEDLVDLVYEGRWRTSIWPVWNVGLQSID